MCAIFGLLDFKGKLTPAERARLEEAENDPETVSFEDINWD